jgi:hypothetical protein
MQPRAAAKSKREGSAKPSVIAQQGPCLAAHIRFMAISRGIAAPRRIRACAQGCEDPRVASSGNGTTGSSRPLSDVRVDQQGSRRRGDKADAERNERCRPPAHGLDPRPEQHRPSLARGSSSRWLRVGPEPREETSVARCGMARSLAPVLPDGGGSTDGAPRESGPTDAPGTGPANCPGGSDQTCHGGAECCSGSCHIPAGETSGYCAGTRSNGQLCLGSGDTVDSSSAECCSSFTSNGVECACRPGGVGCALAGDCCSGECSGGTCQCKALGKLCAAHGDCCSLRCVCGTCKAADGCNALGQSCSANVDCCSDICSGSCDCRAVGVYGPDHSCCSGIMDKNELCACRPAGELCAADSECCSGHCGASGCS